MRGRRRLFGARRGRKRSVGWIDGLSGYESSPSAQSRLIAMAPSGAGATQQLAAIRLVLAADLQLHGGEDAVLERIRGRLLLFAARQGVGGTPAPVAGGMQMRVLITQEDVFDEAGGAILGRDYTTSQALGRDNILWFRDVLVSGSNVTGSGTTGVAEAITLNDYWFDIDVRAKRKIQEDREIYIIFVTQIAGLVANLDFRMLGGIRTLLKRPR